MSALLTFALLALGAASPFRPDAQAIFKDCQPIQNASRGRFYGCPDWNSSITALPGNLSMGGHELEFVRSSTRASLPGEAHEEGKIKLKGGDFPALVFVPADKSGAAEFGFAEATISASKRGVRLGTGVSPGRARNSVAPTRSPGRLSGRCRQRSCRSYPLRLVDAELERD